MALEDRCTPQTASSPTGIDRPSPEIERMRDSSIPLKMSLYVPKSEIDDEESEINIECVSPAPSHGSTKYYDEDDDRSLSHHHHSDHETTPAITFSITNILSEQFGKVPSTPITRNHYHQHLTEFQNNQNISHQNKVKHVPDKKDGLLFRPYDIQNDAAKKNFYKTIFDLTHENLFKLSAKTYPKIHEEVYNRSNGLSPNHMSPVSVQNSYLSDASISKIPPLGGLCKAISQIGQKLPQPQMTPQNLNTRNAYSPAKSDSSYLSTESSQLHTSSSGGGGSSVQKNDSGVDSSDDTRSESGSSSKEDGQGLWPAWVFCTRYSDRPSSGPRYRRPKQPKDKTSTNDDKRPRTAFSSEQLARLKQEFNENRYLTERRRHQLSADLGLNEAQIKIWFQNKRAKIKKSTGHKNPLALQLMAQGLYNHTTVPLTEEEEELEMRMNGKL